MLQRVVVELANVQSPTIVLTTEQQHYLTRVLRLNVGDRWIAMDGRGQSWLVALTPDSHAQIIEPIQHQTELPLAVTLVVALPKGNAFDEVARQATELGVSQIIPVISDRTLLHPSGQKLERWRRIMQEAAEQSERQIVPTLTDPISFQQHLQQINPISQAYLCTPRYAAPHLLACLAQFPPEMDWQHVSPDTSRFDSPTPSSIPTLSLAIGPEGGWTEAEIAQAIAAGYQLVSLGDRILRAVTAPIVALSLIAAVCEQGILDPEISKQGK